MTDTTQRIGLTHHESERRFAAFPSAPEGQPNVLYVVLDDVGYSDLGCFGSSIETPNFDCLSETGLRYSNFHTTTLCSPTRACLLTGRNHHSVGMRYLANTDMGWPSGRGAIDHRAGTLAEILQAQGFATYAVGKWHLAPTERANAAGPFDQWPLGRGFDRFYGFMNGSTDQFYPELFEDNHQVAAPASPEEGYHLSDDLADKAIRFLSDKHAIWPDKPWFLYLCYGAGHFPHQAPQSYLDKYRGRFSGGWDAERTMRLARQKAMGLVPDNAALPPSNPGVEPWDSLTPAQQEVAERLQEAYAALLDHADASFGRVHDFLDRTGQRDNTIIVLISDNGASVDCDPPGTTNVLRWFNQIPEGYEDAAAAMDQIGGPRSATNYPWGWAQASNTPLKLFKSFTHGGGVRDPMVISWPSGIAAPGGMRHQFAHVTDITPTILDVCGIDAPTTIKGVAQMPIHGTSFAYSLDEPEAPTRKQTQYFEMYGHRSVWHQGWKAVTKHAPGEDFTTEHWELYHLDQDFSELRDLSGEEPERLQEMKHRWWAEAGRYGAMPLDDSDALFAPPPRPGAPRWRDCVTFYPPISQIPAEAAPLTQDASHRIDFAVTRPEGTEEGTLLSFGNYAGGYAIEIRGDRLIYVYNHAGLSVTRLESDLPLPAGRCDLSFVFERTGNFAGQASLFVDGAAAGTVSLTGMLLRVSLTGFSVGRANLPPVDPVQVTGMDFNGRIDEVTFSIDRTEGAMPDTLDVD
ncbi:arylsulfatase [Pseudooceanicola algae]|uniref:Sulfatase N-terminal domain-containing protein n=1 Tax=Pseudooceanicola algae TaxID=1537215 RepID=A0A418SLA6_9RHOB|nr:arylsulfatase [Pseudooceanicola algae]QPM90869.1 hypothetical protein PSAL_021110 [Pseudooceanicola algae]